MNQEESQGVEPGASGVDGGNPTPIVAPASGTPAAVPESTRSDASTEVQDPNPRSLQRLVSWGVVAQSVAGVLVAIFTGVLVYYSHRGWQVAKEAADAAAHSADIASKSLALASAVSLSLEEITQTHTLVNGNYFGLNVCFVLANSSGNAAAISRIIATVKAPDNERDYELGREPNEYSLVYPMNEIFPPAKAHSFCVAVSPLKTEQIRMYERDRLNVSLRVSVTLTEPLGTQKTQVFGRRIFCSTQSKRVRTQLTSS
jgi:hypothetical protein